MKFILTLLTVFLFSILPGNAQIWFPDNENAEKENVTIDSKNQGSKPSLTGPDLMADKELKSIPEQIKHLKKKSTIMGITGISSFILGTSGMLAGIAMLGMTEGDFPPGVVLTAVGGTLFVGSIPVMIMAYKARSKARRLELNLSAGAFQSLTPAARGTVPALSLTLNF